MKKYELIEKIKPILDGVAKSGVTFADIQNYALFTDFERLKTEGHKTEYITAYLSEQYNCSRRKIFTILKDMKQEQ